MVEYLVCTEETRVQLTAGPFMFSLGNIEGCWTINLNEKEVGKKPWIFYLCDFLRGNLKSLFNVYRENRKKP